MATTGLFGPHPLTRQGIAAIITYQTPGTYVLGHNNQQNVFVVKYVGRSDDDLADRLGDHVGGHPLYKYGCYSEPKDAFLHECRIYHDFGGPDGKLENDIHPDRPDGTDWGCPVCAVFD